MLRKFVLAFAATAVVATVSTAPAGAAETATAPRIAVLSQTTEAPRSLQRRQWPRRVQVFWWGTVIPLRARLVHKVEKVLTMGSGVAGLVSVLAAAGVVSSPAAIPSGVLAAVLTLGRAALALCNWSDRGVRILVPRMAPVASCLPR